MNSKEEQFLAIYEAYMPLLRIIARKKMIPPDDIDDLIQESFASYYSHYPLDWPDYKIKSTLAKIIRNRCTDYYRRQGTNPVTYYDPAIIQEVALSDSRKSGRDNLSILLEQQECEAVLAAIRSMKEEWEQVFTLHVIEDRPMTEVSRILGVSPEACRARLSRGRKYLRKCLCPEDPEKYRPTARSKSSPLVNISEDKKLPEGT
jgi:RNA polymerase sigma factor, sigma-70 family